VAERWQVELAKLRDLEPPANLWDRAATTAAFRRSPAATARPEMRAARRLVPAIGAALAVALIAATILVIRAATGNGDQAGTVAPHAGVFQDQQFGWTIRYPAGLDVVHISAAVRWPLDGVRLTSFVPDMSNPIGDEPEMGWLRTFPSTGVAAQIWYLGALGGAYSARSAAFPLKPRTFSRTRPYEGGAEPHPFYRYFGANGYAFSAAVWIGHDASAADKRAIWSVIRSLRFPALHARTIYHDAVYVLGRTSAYPVGSVTVIQPSSLPVGPRLRHPQGFYLVHAPRAFYVPEKIFGYPVRPFRTCPVSYNPATSQFYCPGTNLRWNRKGQPIGAHAGDGRQWQLQPRLAAVSTNGHVMYGPSFGPLQPFFRGSPWS
jgi:hypothetical protein